MGAHEHDSAGDGGHTNMQEGSEPVGAHNADPAGSTPAPATNSHAKATIGKAAEVAWQHSQPVTGMADADGVASRLSHGSGTVALIPPDAVAQTDDGRSTETLADWGGAVEPHPNITSFAGHLRDLAEAIRGEA